MAGLGLMNRRRAIAASPTEGTELGAMLKSRIGWYTFEGRTNSDTDREVVQDKSGRGLPMSVNFKSWGTGDDYNKFGYYDDCICCPNAIDVAEATIKIPLSHPLTDSFTIIVDRYYYNVSGMQSYAATIGSTAAEASGTSPLLMDYSDSTPNNIRTSYRGKKLYTGRSNSKIIWMTPDTYCGFPSEESAFKNSYSVNALYLGIVRPNAGAVQRIKIKSVHIFDQSFSAEDVQSYINKYIE